MHGSRTGDIKAGIAAGLAAVLLLIPLLAIVGTHGFWIVDNAAKFLQVQAFIAQDYASFSLPWPGREIDPSFHYNPLPGPFSVIRNGNLYAQYPPFFALLSSLLFRLLGMAGLYVLPLIGFAATMACMLRLARHLDIPPAGQWLLVPAVFAATPLWFYGLVFWEHLPATALACGAMLCLISFAENRRGHITGAILAALTLYFRDEMFLFCAVYLLIALCEKGTARARILRAVMIAGCMLAAVLPLFIFQWFALGHPFGMHAQANLDGIGTHLSTRPLVFYRLFLATGPAKWAFLFFTLPVVLLFILRPAIIEARRGLSLALLSGWGLLALGIAAWQASLAVNPIAFLLSFNSFFSAFPLLLFATFRLDDGHPPPAERVLRTTVILYALAYMLAAPPISAQGAHWGNRFLLILYPPCLLLAFRNLAMFLRAKDLKIAGSALLAVLAAASLLGQAYAFNLLRTKKDFSRRLNAALSNRQESIVITDTWWLPQASYETFYAKTYLYVDSAESFGSLAEKLAAAGHTRALYVTQRPQSAPRVATVNDQGLDFFTVDLYAVPLAREEEWASGRRSRDR